MVSLVDATLSTSSLASVMAAASEGGGGGGVAEFFRQGGIFMYMNLVISAVVIAIVIERIIFQLTKYRVNSKEFFAQIRKLVNANNLDRAIKLCEAGIGGYPTLQLVKSGLTVANRGPDEIDAAMSEKMSEIKPPVDKFIGSLWSLANIATLLGLLGTVSGLIRTFSAVSSGSLSAAERQQKLAAGISEAMSNTAFGLGIAVSYMIAHLLLSNNSKKIVHDLEATQERVFNLLAIQRGGQG
ncbi:MAG: MotA/TolQ/ExbB proton channel family protein [Isosphaeraceae bacterium]